MKHASSIMTAKPIWQNPDNMDNNISSWKYLGSSED